MIQIGHLTQNAKNQHFHMGAVLHPAPVYIDPFIRCI